MNSALETIQCVVCQQPCLEVVKNADLPLCRPCLEKQRDSLKEYHAQLKEEMRKHPEKVLYVSEIDEILPGKLYLGNFEAAENKELLLSKGITHVLVCGEFLDVNYPTSFKYYQLPIQDSLTQTILEYLDSSNQFIEEAERVFVHCAAGVNRSPAIVIAYLMKKNLWTYEESFAFVKARRAKANKQSNFMKQLLEYEQTLGIQREKASEQVAVQE